MLYFIIIGAILVIIAICVMMFLYFKNKYSFLYIKINEAENNLDILLQKKIEILLKIQQLLEKKEVEDLPDVIELKGKKTDHHTLYLQLNQKMNAFTKMIDDYDDKVMDMELDKMLDILNDNENDIRAAIKYYNDNATDIQYYAHRFPSNIVKKLGHYQDTEAYKIAKPDIFSILSNN